MNNSNFIWLALVITTLHLVWCVVKVMVIATFVVFSTLWNFFTDFVRINFEEDEE